MLSFKCIELNLTCAHESLFMKGYSVVSACLQIVDADLQLWPRVWVIGRKLEGKTVAHLLLVL